MTIRIYYPPEVAYEARGLQARLTRQWLKTELIPAYMSVGGMTREYLVRNGFDGLFNENGQCACLADDLAPCDSPSLRYCRPGYRVPCDGTCEAGECDFHIVARYPPIAERAKEARELLFTPTDPVHGIRQMREMVGDAWDGVDVKEWIREERGEDEE